MITWFEYYYYYFFATLVWFPRKSISHSTFGKIHPRLISEQIHAKPPRKTKKIAFLFIYFFAPYAFWICSRGLFAFMPLDLNFTNPKSTIFEPGWKTQPFPVNHDQITKYHLMFLYIYIYIKKTLDRFCILCAGWTSRKYQEISRKLPIFSTFPHFLSNQIESQQAEPQKNENFLHNF